MRRGILGYELTAGAEVVAPTSGVPFARGQAGAVSLRLFRQNGTRIVLASRVLPAQLLAVRTAAAGTPVQVVTSRPQLWEPLLATVPQGRVVPSAEALPATGGPGLFIDDRPAERRSPMEIRSWQCRIDIRTQWTPSELPGFAHTDLVVFGAVPPETAAQIGKTFGLSRRAAEPLCRLDSGSFGLVSRGRFEFVSLNPTPGEGQVLERARGIGSPAAATVSRGSLSRQ